MEKITFFARSIFLLGLFAGVIGKYDGDKHSINIREKRLSDEQRFLKLSRSRHRVAREPYDAYGSLILEEEEAENEVRSREAPSDRRAYGLSQEHRRILELRLKAIVAQRQARDKKTLTRTRFSQEPASTSFSLDSEPQVKTTQQRVGKTKTTNSGFSKPRPLQAIDRNAGLSPQVTRDPSPLIDTWDETATPISPEALQTRTTPEPEIIEAPRVVRPVIFATPSPYRPTRPQFSRRTTTPASIFTAVPFQSVPFQSVPNAPLIDGGSRLSPNEKLDLCCQKQGVSTTCQELCNFDRFTQGSVISAFLNNKCPGQQLSQAFDCASSRKDHTQCCTEMNVHLHNNGVCLGFCAVQNGIPPNPIQYLTCLPVFDTIKNCFRIHQRDNKNLFGD